MRELNLIANGREQERILAYLKENANEILANKINNGVYIEKDGKRLLNKKSLDGFMKYACEEARKQCEKTANSACIDDPVVFGWAIHYFEEDSIEGKLFNEDGSEYKPAGAKPKSQQITQPQIVKKQNNQASIFDLMADTPQNNESNEHQNQSNEIAEVADEDEEYPQPTPDEVQEILAELDEEDKKAVPIPEWYKTYTEVQKQYPTDIVAYRLGDFYEIFGDKAVAIANELSLTITSRDCHLESRVPMVGFPYHAAEIYCNRICQNHALVIVEDKNQIRRLPKQRVDVETGELLDDIPQSNERIDERLLAKLRAILGDVFIVR